jgi:hypothetical protein
MITIKGFAIVPRKINLRPNETYYCNCISSPVSEVYNTKEEAEIALKENKQCYIGTENLWVMEVEVILKSNSQKE